MSKKGTGGNLSNPVRRFLINDLTTFDAGVFTDSTTGLKNLILKKLGYQLTSLAAGSNITITRQCTTAGQLKVVSVNFDDACPCEECGFDYGIDILIQHMTPGYFNDFVQQQQKPYAGQIANVTCASGVIDSSQLNTAKDDIINQINADLGYMNQYSGANVIAGRCKLLTQVGAWDATNAITINGHAIAAAATRALFITNINTNANLDAYAFVDPLTVTGIYVIARTAPTTLTIVTTAGTIVVPTLFTIGIISKDVKWTFEVQIQHLDATGTITEIQASKFPFLTSDDVFRLFAGGGNKHHGNLVTQGYITQPIDGASYCKYIIEVEDMVNDLSGSSHYEFLHGTIELYIRNIAANLSTNIWDATNYMWESTNAGFAADQTWAQVLTYWTT
jgi:hypothetical protein